MSRPRFFTVRFMQKERGTYSSTDLCDECGKTLRECACICIKHSCCGGGRDYEGHLTDCRLMNATA